MKLSELSFKVITGTEERNRAIQEALFAKGGAWCNDEKEVKRLDAVQLSYNAKLKTDRVECRLNGLRYSGMRFSPKHFFNEVIAPEVTFQQALDMIAQVEEPQPEFPLKPKDWCMVTDKNSIFGWKLAVYSHIVAGVFHCVGSQYDMIAQFDEQLIGVGKWPKEWWEIKDGKPVLVKRGK